MKIVEFIKYFPQASLKNTRMLNIADMQTNGQVDIKKAPTLDTFNENDIKEYMDKELAGILVINEERKEVRNDGEKSFTVICFIIVYKEGTDNETQEVAESNS